MSVIMYKNKLNGNYDVERRSSAWFTDKFLESFDYGEYHAQEGRLKPWQYKGLMELAESNKWKMLTPKQWDVFRNNVRFDRGTYEEFAHFRTKSRKVSITISDATGFVTIKIAEVDGE